MRIGIDIGGTNIAAGLVDENGKIVRKLTVPTERKKGYEYIVDKINTIVNELSGKSKESLSLGIAVPGSADKRGNIVKCLNLGWENLPIAEDVERLTGIRPHVENDSNAAAIGEYMFGSAKGTQSLVMLTLGTGVGSGIIMDGRLVKGFHGAAGEIGHMVVGENFYNCTCGKNGCLETFASASALSRDFKRLASTGEDYTLAIEMAGGDLELVDAKTIVDAAKSGDVLSLVAVERLCFHLARGIVNIINIIDPQVIIIGGGLSKAGGFIMENLRGKVERDIFYKGLGHADILRSYLGEDSGIVGAAFLEDFMKSL